ncbi:MAG: MFS transporter [Caulobacteraceae bacterium]
MTRTSGDWRLVILLVGLTQLVITTDFSILTVALPSIGRSLRLAPSLLSLVISAGALTGAGFLILAGRAADIFGQRRCMLTGLTVFAAGSLMAALAPGFAVLIAARALQGLGGAILAPANFSLINTLVPEGAPRHRALGVFGIMQGLSLIVGLLLGGALTTRFGWRADFLLNPPIVAAAIALTLRAVPPVARKIGAEASIDTLGAVLISAGTACLLVAISLAGRLGAGSAVAWALLATSLAAFAAFWVVEGRVARPLAPPSLFRRRNFAAATAVGGLHLAGVGGLFVLISLYMQTGLHLSAFASGLGMMPYAASVILAGQIAPAAMARFPRRTVVWFGFAIYLAGLVLLAANSGRGSYMTAVAPWSVICAFGSLLSFVALMGEATADVPADQQGVASAILFTVQQIGVPLGAAVALSVLASGGRGEGGISLRLFGIAYAATAGLVGVGFLVALAGLRPAMAPLAAPAPHPRT